jgi:hypothetical protein
MYCCVGLLLLLCWRLLAMWLLLLRVRSFRSWLLSLLLQRQHNGTASQIQCATVLSATQQVSGRKQLVQHNGITAMLPAGKALQLAVGMRNSWALCTAHHCYLCSCSTHHFLLNACGFAPVGCSQHAGVPASQPSSVVSQVV